MLNIANSNEFPELSGFHSKQTSRGTFPNITNQPPTASSNSYSDMLRNPKKNFATMAHVQSVEDPQLISNNRVKKFGPYMLHLKGSDFDKNENNEDMIKFSQDKKNFCSEKWQKKISVHGFEKCDQKASHCFTDANLARRNTTLINSKQNLPSSSSLTRKSVEELNPRAIEVKPRMLRNHVPEKFKNEEQSESVDVEKVNLKQQRMPFRNKEEINMQVGKSVCSNNSDHIIKRSNIDRSYQRSHDIKEKDYKNRIYPPMNRKQDENLRFATSFPRKHELNNPQNANSQKSATLSDSMISNNTARDVIQQQGQVKIMSRQPSSKFEKVKSSESPLSNSAFPKSPLQNRKQDENKWQLVKSSPRKHGSQKTNLHNPVTPGDSMSASYTDRGVIQQQGQVRVMSRQALSKSEKLQPSELPLADPKGQLQQNMPASTKKKKRPKPAKRKKVFQTGKLLILSSELHNRISSQMFNSNITETKQQSLDATDIHDYDEYPDLAQAATVSLTKSKRPDTNQKQAMPELSKLNINADPFQSRIYTNEQNLEEKKNESTHTEEKNEVVEESLFDLQKEPVNSKVKKCPRNPIKLVDLLAPVEPSEKKAEVELEAEVIVPLPLKVIKPNEKSHAPNVLDSSAPVKKRGKEREKPKPKKVSALKKVILSAKEEKKKQRADNERPEGAEFRNEMQSTTTPLKWQLMESVIAFAEDFSNACIESAMLFLKDKLVDGEANACEDSSGCPPDEHSHIDIAQVQQCEDSVPIQSPADVQEDKMEERMLRAIQILIHTRNFRTYCNHLLNQQLDECALSLLGDLYRFQDRIHKKDATKGFLKRRLTYGMKEVSKYLKLKKIKCVIIAPNVQDIKAEGGLNDAIDNLIRLCKEYHSPYAFACDRKQLGQVSYKTAPVSCIGVFSCEGAEAKFKKLMELVEESTKDYNGLCRMVKENITSDDIDGLFTTAENAPNTLLALRKTILQSIIDVKNTNSDISCNNFQEINSKYKLKM